MEKIKQMKGGINNMKKTGMFLAVILVASLFAGSFAIAQASISAVGADGASISAEEAEITSGFTIEEIESIDVTIDNSLGPNELFQVFPERTTMGHGWVDLNFGSNENSGSGIHRAAFVHVTWKIRKNSEGEEVAFGKLRVGKTTYKMKNVGKVDGKTLRFSLHGADGITGKFTLFLKENMGHMKLWEGIFSFNGVTGDVTLATTTNRIKNKPTIDSGTKTEPSSVSRKPIDVTTESGDDSKVSFGNEATAKKEKKGFFGRIFDFFKGKK